MTVKQIDLPYLLNICADMRRVANWLVQDNNEQTIKIFLRKLKKDFTNYNKPYPDLKKFFNQGLIKKTIVRKNRLIIAEELLTSSLRLQHWLGF